MKRALRVMADAVGVMFAMDVAVAFDTRGADKRSHLNATALFQPPMSNSHAAPCSCCGGRMILIEFFERGVKPSAGTRARAPSRDSS
jgi:hypothetical protein